jgi:H+-translocating NAD(P) transhydrogenase subunit beta
MHLFSPDLIPNGIQVAYLIATTLFFVGLKYLGSPATARQGNSIAAVGMLIAIVGTLVDRGVVGYTGIVVGVAVGSAIGAIGAYKVEMTAMPQMVGLLNGLGGGASTLIAVAEFWRVLHSTNVPAIDERITLVASILIGGITLTGSLIAFAKLQEIMSGSPITFPMQQLVNIALFAGFGLGSVCFVANPHDPNLFFGLTALSLVLGILFVIPIGGADMPVVISLLNSFSGIAASAAGFVLMNNILIIAGALVGASGIILTQIMCKGMNRTLSSVLFGAFGAAHVAAASAAGGATNKTARTVEAEECAMMLGYARSVAIVPGYGMAVAQAQHSVRELADQLERLGVEVKYAIHPVAGRMPGHMNVLLAEANVPYPQLYDMEDINPEFERVDVALVIGANDVVNPAARHDTSSPIYGMPILEVDRAKHAIVIKRGMSAGFAGVDNELFYQDKTMMLFGSAKDVVGKLVSEVKQL